MPSSSVTRFSRRHPIVREGFGSKIGTEPDISVVAEARSEDEAILSKLGVSDRTQAVITALKRGLVHLQ
jgi:DNA-binding NarL/FixJ family response regulator